MGKFHKQVVNGRKAVNKGSSFIGQIYESLGSLVGENGTAVKIILTVLEGILIDIANGKGKFEGLDLDGRQEAVNRSLDSAIETLTGLLGVSARLAVCLSLAGLGSGMRSRLGIAA